MKPIILYIKYSNIENACHSHLAYPHQNNIDRDATTSEVPNLGLAIFSKVSVRWGNDMPSHQIILM